MDLDLPEKSVFAPRIPSLITPPVKYAAPYSNIKGPLSKLDYVMMKSTPTTHICTSCKLMGNVTTNSVTNVTFTSSLNQNCTIYCLNNPQLWLPEWLLPDVRFIELTLSEDYMKLMNDPNKKLDVSKAMSMFSKLFNEWVTRKIQLISWHLNNDQQMIQVVNVFKTSPNNSYYKWTYNAFAYRQKSSQDAEIHIFDQDATYLLHKLPDGRIAVQSKFEIFGSAIKAPQQWLVFEPITLFYIN